METKKYWQAKDKTDRAYTYDQRPELYPTGNYVGDGCCSKGILFPIPLKPLQIAEITVCDDGTWSYEIEREEGWYFVKHKRQSEVTFWRYESGKWYYERGEVVGDYQFKDVNISPTRIPDECII